MPRRLPKPVQKGNKPQRKQLYGTALLIIGVVLLLAWALVVGGR